MNKKLLTLVIVVRNGQVLLGMKKRGFGAGRWNGFGGKVEEGETVEGAAARELQEEVGLVAQKLEQVGLLRFTFRSEPQELEVHIFTADTIFGEPCETEEMRPRWFSCDTIPYAEMWPDDEYWLPLVLAGERVRGVFHFDVPAGPSQQATILAHDMRVVADFSDSVY